MRLVAFDPVLVALLLLASGRYLRALRIVPRARPARLRVAAGGVVDRHRAADDRPLGPPDAYDDAC